MAGVEVLEAVQGLISSLSVSGGALEFIGGFGVATLPQEDNENFPYLVLSEPVETRLFSTNEADYTTVEITVSLFDRQKDATQTSFKTLRDTLNAIFDGPKPLVSFTAGSTVNVSDITTQATELVETAGSHVWEYQWILVFDVRTQR